MSYHHHHQYHHYPKLPSNVIFFSNLSRCQKNVTTMWWGTRTHLIEGIPSHLILLRVSLTEWPVTKTWPWHDLTLTWPDCDLTWPDLTIMMTILGELHRRPYSRSCSNSRQSSPHRCKWILWCMVSFSNLPALRVLFRSASRDDRRLGFASPEVVSYPSR